MNRYVDQTSYSTRTFSLHLHCYLPIRPFWVNKYTSSFLHAVHAYARATVPRFNTNTHNLCYTHGTHIKELTCNTGIHVSFACQSISLSVSYTSLPFPLNCFAFWHLLPLPSNDSYYIVLAQLSHSFSRNRYSLADNLAELVNFVEENFVVRHSSNGEVEEVDRMRRLYAPKGASMLYEFVIIRSVFRCASSLSSVGLGRRCAVVSCRAVWNTRRRERSRV